MDLNARWEELAAAADEDACVFRAGRCSEIPRLAQADLIEIEDFGEEGAELGIAPDPVLGENKGAALASSDGVVITLTTVIQSSVRLRIRKSAISAAISGPESSWRKCRPVTRCGPSACDRAAWIGPRSSHGRRHRPRAPRRSSSAGGTQRVRSRGHPNLSSARAVSSIGIQRGHVQVRRRAAGSGSAHSYACCVCVRNFSRSTTER